MIDGLPIVLHKEPPRQKIQQEEPLSAANLSGKSQTLEIS